jgi:hypothetical protein
MCTSVVEIVRAEGAGVSEGGWFPVTSAAVSYDHPHHALLEDAITIDFMNPALGPGARAAVEITLESAKGLLAALERVIAEAEEGGRAGAPSVTKDEGGRMKDDPRSAAITPYQSSVVTHLKGRRK